MGKILYSLKSKLVGLFKCLLILSARTIFFFAVHCMSFLIAYLHAMVAHAMVSTVYYIAFLINRSISIDLDAKRSVR